MGEKIYELSELIEYLKELEARIKELKAENKRLKEVWFKKGQMSVKRKNKSGCCCIINDDDEIEEMCALHNSENQRLREASTPIVKLLSEKGEISSDLIRDLQKALEK